MILVREPSNKGFPIRVRVSNEGHQAASASISLQDCKRLNDKERCFTGRVWPIKGGGILSNLLEVRTTRSKLGKVKVRKI
jgi:hypothetical protein